MVTGNATSQPVGHYDFCQTHRSECGANRNSGPVAMMEIDVEHGDPLRAVIEQPLGRHTGIVDETIATEEIHAGMVAGRAAEREGEAVAGVQPIRARHRTAHRGNGCLVGSFGDGRIGSIGIMADRADDVFRYALAAAADWEGIGDRLALVSSRHPAIPHRRQELQIGGIVHLARSFQAMRLRRNNICKTCILHRGKDPFYPERRLEGRHKLAIMQFCLRITQLVVFGIDDAHECPPQISLSKSSLTQARPKKKAPNTA